MKEDSEEAVQLRERIDVEDTERVALMISNSCYRSVEITPYAHSYQ